MKVKYYIQKDNVLGKRKLYFSLSRPISAKRIGLLASCILQFLRMQVVNDEFFDKVILLHKLKKIMPTIQDAKSNNAFFAFFCKVL